MKLDWIAAYPGIGSAFGYSTCQRRLYEALERSGVVFDNSADTVVHIIPPYFFSLLRFKKNVLMTMFEYDRIPSQWGYLLDQAELVIVPCRQNQRTFSAVTDTPVEVCPLGVEAERFPYVKREKTDPFVFLFLGDDNPRKGTAHIAKAWEMWNEKYPEIAKKTILIMKMTSLFKEQKRERVTHNAYVDYRVLPLKESKGEDGLPTLGSLYAYANAFLFPSMGEGWGLTLCEAMCSGLPCIYTPQGGSEDFASAEYAYPVEYGYHETKIMDPRGIEVDPVNVADPNIESIVAQMHEVYTNYDTALDKGLTAAAAMREWFTWDHAAQKFKDIIERNIA